MSCVAKLLVLSSLVGLCLAKAKAAPPPAPPPNWPYFVAIAAAAVVVGQLVKGLPPFVGTALGAAFAFSVLEAADTFIPYPIVTGGHAAVTAILFATPLKSAPVAAVAKGVIGGHVIAAGAAIGLAMGLPQSAAFAIKTVIVTLAVGAQSAAAAVHPPACALAFVWATTAETDATKLVGPLIGCAVLIACQQVWNTLNKEKKA